MHQCYKTSAQSSIKQISDSKNSKKEQLAYQHVILPISKSVLPAKKKPRKKK
jgi:hypothetical protein